LAALEVDENCSKMIERIGLDGDNMRAVLAAIKDDQPGLTLRFTGSLLQFESGWLSPREANDWLEPAIEKARTLLEAETTGISMTDFIRALVALGWLRVTHGQMATGLPVLEEVVKLARQQGQFRFSALASSMKLQALGARATPKNIQEVEEALVISRREGYELEQIMALMTLGTTYLFQNQYEKGKATITEMSRLVETFAFGPVRAWMYLTRARLAQMEGNTAEAERNLLLALELQEKMKDHRMAATIRSRLAHTYREAGRLGAAEAQYRRTILSWQEQGHQTAVANQVECFAYITASRGNDAHAARLLGAAQAARQRLNEPITYPNEVAEYTAVIGQLGEMMGPPNEIRSWPKERGSTWMRRCCWR
jgi:tetratricopeptide (TPR) repeat protein